MGEAEQLGWVTEAQQQWLDQQRDTRGDWRDWLPAELDQRWPEWREADGTEVSGYLDGLESELAVAAVPSAEAVDPLSWVTAHQQEQLDTVNDTRGPWRDWLPGQLDAWWPEWTGADASTLQAWFDSALPSLVPEQPAAGGTPAEAAPDPTPASTAAASSELARLIAASPELANLSESDLHDLLSQALAGGGDEH